MLKQITNKRHFALIIHTYISYLKGLRSNPVSSPTTLSALLVASWEFNDMTCCNEDHIILEHHVPLFVHFLICGEMRTWPHMTYSCMLHNMNFYVILNNCMES